MRASLEKYGDWAKAKEALGADLKKAIRTALSQEAEFMADKVRENLKKGPFTPLSPLTLAMRKLQGFKGTKPLQRTGDLLNSIKAVEGPDGDEFFIGVPRSVKAKDGESYVRIAAVHEYGKTIVIKVTPKMKAFFFAMLKKLGKGLKGKGGGGFARGFLIIHIPARPFITPAFEEFGPTLPDRFLKRLARETKGLLGE